MAFTAQQITTHTVFDPAGVERIAYRNHKEKIAIIEPDSTWPARFTSIKDHISNALQETMISCNHVGSTSVPCLPAKDVIDMDLEVKDIYDEASYVRQLEGLGFRFLFREPAWHQHRFFVGERSETKDEGQRYGNDSVNLHVWGPNCPEIERHRIFREWLMKTPEDLALYARTKREAAVAATEAGESMQDYNLRKEKTIQEILERAFKDSGYE